MTVDFNDYFWGEKNNGFDVLYHNMKFGLVASKELSEFFREKSNIEEQNSKLMSKLAHKASTGTLSSTFAPVWTILRTSAEKLSTLHLQMMHKLTELVKDVTKYADELHKKHKSVKEEESQTLECVQAMQGSTAAVQKSRDLFASKVLELEKLRKENASQKDIEKVEAKLKKMQEEYKALLDKHNPIKAEFERRMTLSCKRFQDIEELHLRQMKEFLSTYLEMIQNNHDMVGQVHSDFKRQFLDMTVDKLLEQFVLNKYTGLEKPEIPELSYVALSSTQTQQNPSSLSSSAARLSQPSVSASAATNSNSATSLRVGARSDIMAGSLGSGSGGSGSLLNADDSVSGVMPTPRPISPEITNTIQQQQQQIQQPQQQQLSTETTKTITSTTTTTTTTVVPAATSTTASSTSVRSNFLNWFSSNQSKGNIASTAATPSTGTNGTTATTTTTTSTADASTSSGNFGTESFGSSTGTVITKNLPNPELLQSLQDNNNEVSGILRSRREKTKAKKSKKKKDGGSADNIQEENGAGAIDRNSAGTNFDSHFESTKSGSKLTTASGLSFGGANSVLANSESPASAIGSGVSGAAMVGAAGASAQSSNTNVTSGTKADKTVAGGASVAEVDEDGYSVQPAKEVAWEERQDNAGSFYSDSDSDSDHDKPERRIHVKIKPLNNGQAPMSASVDELRATVENISLSPTGVFSHSQQLQQSRIPSRQQSPEISNASTPTATVHPYAPLQSPTLSMTNNTRYADLGDIFSELGEVSASAPASASLAKANSRQIPTPTSGGSIAIPRPPSRRSEMVTSAGISVARGRNSPSPMNRADSIGSLEFRTAIGGIGSSRGPSPLTIGISDTIPLAVAFHEIIHAFFRGSDESRCQVKISGDMMLSFPAGIAGLLANNPNPARLGFRIKNVQNLENLIPNSKLVQIDRAQSTAFSTVIEFNMAALTALLRRQAEHNPNASYFNVDILKYQARSKPGASSCPFQLVCYWKCEQTFTALKIDYKYNNHAMASASPLLNVKLSVPVNGSVRNVQSKPHSVWLGESNRLVWNFTDVSQNSPDGGVGTLRARLELNEGPSTAALLTTQFNCEGTTLSGIEFELQGGGYRLSLVKRRFVSGKYVCEGDGIRGGSTPTPPTGSVGSCSPFSAKSN